MKDEVDSSDTLHMLSHLVRTRNHIKYKTPKSVLRTSGALVQTTMAHFHSSCIGSPATLAGNGDFVRRLGCPLQWVAEDIAHLAHYRKGCALTLQKVPQESGPCSFMIVLLYFFTLSALFSSTVLIVASKRLALTKQKFSLHRSVMILQKTPWWILPSWDSGRGWLRG